MFQCCLAHKISFSDWIIKSSKSRHTITLHNDVFYTPISALKLAYFAHKLIDMGCSGIFNISADEVITKYEFGLLLCNNLKISPEFIKPGSLSQREDLVIRPKSMGLSNQKISKLLGYKIGDINQQIKSI